MAFFTKQQKRLAKKLTPAELNQVYTASEQELKAAAATGKERQLKKAMDKHRTCEYAKLYQNTPQFKKSQGKASVTLPSGFKWGK